MTAPLSWTASHFGRRLIVVAGLALAGSFALARPELVAVTAVPVAWLAIATRRGAPGELSVDWSLPPRCFEHEPVPVTISVHLDAPVDLIRLTLVPAAELRAGTRPLTVTLAGTAHATLTSGLVATRWGRRPVGYVMVECWTQGRLRHATQVLRPPGALAVYPRPASTRRLPISSVRYDRAGDHAAAAAGAGIEFHAVRPFTTGDSPRRINWPVSTRRGALYVTTTRAERAVDVVLAVDVLTDAGSPGHSSRDLALRGATGAAQAVLRAHDRVGLIAVGGRLKWLRPDLAERQLYRITEALLEVVDWDSYLDPDVDTVPYTALPAGAQIVYFSPLLDDRGVTVARVLRARGHPVIVVDVCTSEPAAQRADAVLALRLWRLERNATRNRLADLGVTVVGWDGAAALDMLLRPLLRPAAAARR